MIQLTKINHPIYTNKLQSDSNLILFDVRPAKDYLKRFVLKYRILAPGRMINKGANLLYTSNQIDLNFDSRQDARQYLVNNIISFL